METIINSLNKEVTMISVGIDVSKEKSTVCIVKPCSEILIKPFEVNHTEDELCKLNSAMKTARPESARPGQ